MFAYTDSMSLSDVPTVAPDVLARELQTRLAASWRVLALFGLPGENGACAPGEVGLCCVLAHDASGRLAAWRTPPLTSYPSMTPACPAVHRFEREVFEQWGIRPEGHPWLKPVRFCPARNGDPAVRPGPGEAEFYRIRGEQVHEVAVGPVHAGVIEPGHFRFQCYGENVMHLEIHLGFQHRNLERMLETADPSRGLILAERAAGDTTIAHAWAYCALLERLLELEVPERAQRLRRIALELERLANHTGDLGAVAGDVGFLPTASWNGRIRGDFLNLTAELCGNRFGRGLLCPGGVLHDLDAAKCVELTKRLRAAHRDVRGAVDVMLHSASVLNRLIGTGTVSRKAAQDLGLVGMAARACGLRIDARFFFPALSPAANGLSLRTRETGDVLARAEIRSLEIDDAAACVEEDLACLAEDGGVVRMPRRAGLPAHRLCAAQVEGWRGEVCHVGVTDGLGRWRTYKIVDPSFHNWDGLALALRDGQISDFPLCNKSFNLSYCGHDL